MWKTLKSVVRPQGRYKLMTSVMSTLTRRCSHRSARCGGGCASYRTRNIPCPGTRRTHRKEPEDWGEDHDPRIQTDLLQGVPDVQGRCQGITTSQISPFRQEKDRLMERKQSPTCTLHDNRRKEKVGGRVFHLLQARFSIGNQSRKIRTTKWTWHPTDFL